MALHRGFYRSGLPEYENFRASCDRKSNEVNDSIAKAKSVLLDDRNQSKTVLSPNYLAAGLTLLSDVH